MFDFDPLEAVKSLNNCDFPMFHILLNGKEFTVRKIEALILSSKIQNLLKNDESIDTIIINIDIDEVFENKYKMISHFDFCEILWSSFDIILRNFQQLMTGYEKGDKDENVMNLEELCCSKVILEKLGSKTIRANDGKYRNITKGNAVEILNVVGNKESIEFVANNFECFNCSKIYPEMLEKVLKSPKLKVENEKRKLEAVLSSIKKYGSKAGFLLGCVEINMLQIKDRYLYSTNVLNYLSNVEAEMQEKDISIGNDDKNVNKIAIDRSIIDNLLKYIEGDHGKGLLVSDQSLITYSIPENFNIGENLNKAFNDKIQAIAKNTSGGSPKNVLIANNDDLIYMSSWAGEQWIRFDFPEKVCIKRLKIKPNGNSKNPKKLIVEAILCDQYIPIAVCSFPDESCRRYSFWPTEDLFSNSFIIRMKSTTYSREEFSVGRLILKEVIFYGLRMLKID